MKPIRVCAVLALTIALSGCGLRGSLEKPPPMFGEARRQYETEQRQKAEAAEKERLEKEKARLTVTIPVSPVEAPQDAPPLVNPK